MPNSEARWATDEVERRTGAPGRIRTHDPQIRSLVLYPAELPVHLGRRKLGIEGHKGKRMRSSSGHAQNAAQPPVAQTEFPPESVFTETCPSIGAWLRLNALRRNSSRSDSTISGMGMLVIGGKGETAQGHRRLK